MFCCALCACPLLVIVEAVDFAAATFAAAAADGVAVADAAVDEADVEEDSFGLDICVCAFDCLSLAELVVCLVGPEF